ncbi:MAG: hypothetical protein U0R44_01045 [Candidatus Micrarchaeia archaeon]
MKLMKNQVTSEHQARPNYMARAAAVAASILINLSPLLETPAFAQDNPQGTSERRDAPAQARTFEGIVTPNYTVLSLINSERVMEQQVSPRTIAELRVSAIDQTGIELSVTLISSSPGSNPLSSSFRVNFDGTRSGNATVLQNLGLTDFRAQAAEGGKATVSFNYSDTPTAARSVQQGELSAEEAPYGPASVGPRVASDRPARPRIAIDTRDMALHPFADRVNMSGRARDITLNHNWDIGGNVYANEAGSSVWATVRFSLRGEQTSTPLDLRLSGGNMWFGEQMAPFARLFVRPSVEFWNFKLAYYGSLATVGNMPSTIYTSHSVGFGYSQPIGDNARLRIGVVGGGALSYPAWDDIYFQLATGASFQYKDFLVYAMPNFYFAAPDPIKVAYVGYYTPQFQNIEFGAQLRFLDDMYTGRLFGDISTLYQRFGGRLTRSFNLSDDVSLDVWGGLGATHWIEPLGGRWDPVVFAGINVVLGGRVMNSTSTIRYEHLQAGGVRFARTELPTNASPGPYGFGRSGSADVDAQVNRAKDRFLSSDSLNGFSTSYGGASQNDLIMTARFMGAFAQQAAYANNAWNSLNSTQFFDSEVRRIASQSPETIYQFMRRMVDFYNTHSPGTPLPPELASGIAMCGGIGYVQAAFLNANGIPTIVASVNTRHGPHMVPIAMPPNGTVLLDYGNTYETPPGTFDQAMRFYGQNRQAPTFQSQIFGTDGRYMGTYITSEGRILHESIGIVNMQVLGTDFLGVR